MDLRILVSEKSDSRPIQERGGFYIVLSKQVCLLKKVGMLHVGPSISKWSAPASPVPSQEGPVQAREGCNEMTRRLWKGYFMLTSMEKRT